MLFARRVAALNRGQLTHNGYLRISAPERLRIPRALFNEAFAGLEGAAAEQAWAALLARRTGAVTRFSANVIEVADHDEAPVPLTVGLTEAEHEAVRAWADRLGLTQEELLRAAVRACLDGLSGALGEAIS
ncbi:MAG: hypothetical protein NTZ05_20805 [Chloroflexi bacterium]|nr:hypothetical protein [Chloroflexota bacterium]